MRIIDLSHNEFHGLLPTKLFNYFLYIFNYLRVLLITLVLPFFFLYIYFQLDTFYFNHVSCRVSLLGWVYVHLLLSVFWCGCFICFTLPHIWPKKWKALVIQSPFVNSIKTTSFWKVKNINKVKIGHKTDEMTKLLKNNENEIKKY